MGTNIFESEDRGHVIKPVFSSSITPPLVRCSTERVTYLHVPHYTWSAHVCFGWRRVIEYLIAFRVSLICCLARCVFHWFVINLNVHNIIGDARRTSLRCWNIRTFCYLRCAPWLQNRTESVLLKEDLTIKYFTVSGIWSWFQTSTPSSLIRVLSIFSLKVIVDNIYLPTWSWSDGDRNVKLGPIRHSNNVRSKTPRQDKSANNDEEENLCASIICNMVRHNIVNV